MTAYTREIILTALIEHRGHDGIPGAPEGVLCVRCNAERALETMMEQGRIVTERYGAHWLRDDTFYTSAELFGVEVETEP